MQNLYGNAKTNVVSAIVNCGKSSETYRKFQANHEITNVYIARTTTYEQKATFGKKKFQITYVYDGILIYLSHSGHTNSVPPLTNLYKHHTKRQSDKISIFREWGGGLV